MNETLESIQLRLKKMRTHLMSHRNPEITIIEIEVLHDDIEIVKEDNTLPITPSPGQEKAL